MKRAPDAGFSLIEVMAALAILSVGAIALIGATEAHVRRIGDLERRAVAQIVAENRAAELSLGAVAVEDLEDRVSMLGGDWIIRQRIEKTDEQDIGKAVLHVVSADDGAPYARLIGFVDRGE